MAAVLCLGLAAALPAKAQDLDWAKRAGGSSSDQGRGIAADGAGNSYVTGTFNGTATFGAGDANEAMLTSAGGEDIFVAKYDASGALVWAKRAGGTSSDQGLGIATDGAGNSYVTGRIFSTATFGPGEANETMLTSAGSFDVFVAKYGASGALVWAKRAGGTGPNIGLGIAADGAGSSYVTGSFDSTATFGPGEANETMLTSAGSFDVFVAKYDASGALVWAKAVGGTTSADQGRGIAADGAGNSYVTGLFFGTATFGPGEANETMLTSASTDIFVAKYDASGVLVWAKRAGDTGPKVGHGIATDGAGNSYVTGEFYGPATFGPGEANETMLTSAGSFDVFVAKYDASGALVWAKRAGGTGTNIGRGIAADGAGDSYVTGLFDSTATFGPGEANETMLTSAVGDEDIFVARFSGVVDADGDGIADGEDNCRDDANPDQIDTDGDEEGDACDGDDDNDAVADAADNCPLDPNADQADLDGDGFGNVCDSDDDNDGVIDGADLCVPTAAGQVVDGDGCAIADLCPCDSGWKNHGAYVSCVAHATNDFVDLGLIGEAEKGAIVSAAGQSSCGKKK